MISLVDNIKCFVLWFKMDVSKMPFEHKISDTKRTLELLEEEKITTHFELQNQYKLSALKT